VNEGTDTSRRGTWLIVRCFGNEARRVRLWEENEYAVWVQSDEEYRRRSEGYQALWPVGFRRHAVFEDDPEFFAAYEPCDEFWAALKPFKPLDAGGTPVLE